MSQSKNEGELFIGSFKTEQSPQNPAEQRKQRQQEQQQLRQVKTAEVEQMVSKDGKTGKTTQPSTCVREQCSVRDVWLFKSPRQRMHMSLCSHNAKHLEVTAVLIWC